MTSEAVDKFQHREKKKTLGREKTYLIIVTSMVMFFAVGSIDTFTKSKIIGDTSENNEEMNTEENEVEHVEVEDKNDEEHEEGNDDYEEADEDNSDDYEYDDWTEIYFGEEIWVECKNKIFWANYTTLILHSVNGGLINKNQHK